MKAISQQVPKIGITGLPNAGKTETLIRIVKKLEDDGYRVGGMLTKPIEKDGKQAILIRDWRSNKEVLFADTESNIGCRVGEYNIDTKQLDSVGTKAIEDAVHDEETDIVIVDEVGKMEMLSERFCDVVKEALDSGKMLILTLHKKSRNSLLQDIRRRDDVRLLEVTPINKNLLPYKIEKILNP
jgi:nucleoside-triphosphatase